MLTDPATVQEDALVGALLHWFDEHERPLPWRATTPWGVLVSEFMLQQTPVDRVLPVWHEWLARWPTPAALAAAPLADALRGWGRLGYPRRAKRLHEAAVVITRDHEGVVPSELDDLRALPGVGDYTAAAVRAFAYGRRSVVLDTNVRRVLARVFDGQANAPAHITAGERSRADALWPQQDARSARWSAAVMEFGALTCTARKPACDACPVRGDCSWTLAGQPESSTRTRRQPRYDGSDRQARGHVLHAIRQSQAPVAAKAALAGWPDRSQAERALAGLLADGLVVRTSRGRVALPH